MAPFEAYYGRTCRSPIGWFDAFEVRPWGTDLLRYSLDKVKRIQEKLLASQSRLKEYADRKVRDLEFMEAEKVLLKECIRFNVSMLKRYHGDGNYIIRWDSVLLDENFTYEEKPVAILDREICKLRSREIESIKVQWKNRPVEESTLEKDADMRERYPHLFTDSEFKVSCRGKSSLLDDEKV
ncbi:uncharacterized protein [Solanum lycopersicum]|uniref:uncharacterized protein n=1 Tax=Solanum lycopersicum TaxID=4081 RepID=UPI00374786C4